jgi:glycosyltransferase 2 family protein
MRAHLRTALLAALAVGLIAWFLRNADLAGVWREFLRGDWWLLLVALVFQVVTWVCRAIRWRYLLRPLGNVRFRSAFECTLIGFAAITLLPARAGEVVRPYLLAKREHLSASAAFATIVVERLLDLATVLVLFGAVVVLGRPPEGATNPAIYHAMQVGGAILGVGGLVGLGILFIVAGHPETLTNVVARLSRFFPERIAHTLAGLAGRFAQGLAIVRQPGRLLVAWLLSFPLWLTISWCIWWGALAFHIHLPFTGSLVLTALLVVGVAVPTPGGIGGYHEMFRIGTTALYGAANDQAVSAAIVMHAISFIPITIAGLAVMAREGLNLARVRAMTHEPAAEENAT